MYKKCKDCKKKKLLAEFSKLATNKTGRANSCKVCKRAYDNAYYAANVHRRNAVTSTRRAQRLNAHRFVCEYLLTHFCVDCGEADPIVLEFDHVRGKKLASISVLKNRTRKTVEREIKKCVVRCANCHRRKTAKQFSWRSKIARKFRR